MERGAAGLVVAGECLTGPIRDRLYAWIGAQPAWSDPAIIIVGGAGDAEQLDPPSCQATSRSCSGRSP
jgi:hypothetical protein